MRRLSGIYADYSDRVAIVAVDTDPTESAEHIRSYAETRRFEWPMATLHRDVVIDYGVRTQSTKVGIDASGVVVLREGYGTQSAEEWVRWMDVLAGGA